MAKPSLQCTAGSGSVQELPAPGKVVLFLGASQNGGGAVELKIGDAVKTGQRIGASPDSDEYVISSVTGTVSDMSPYMGTSGRKYTAIVIDASGQDDWDSGFTKAETLDTALKFFGYGPGSPCFKAFADPEKSIRTIIINGMDEDLLLTANQYVVRNEGADIKAGVAALKKMTGAERIFITVPEGLVQQAAATGAEVKTISASYPGCLPHMIMKDVVGEVVLAGDTVEDAGVVFMSAEAVAAIGAAFSTGQLRVSKVVTVVGKDGSATNMRVRIGPPISDVLQACNISLSERDRLILGGPMRGVATYSEELPVEPD
ncbi:MAG: hypothetical protein JRI47_02235, partial [Deltaproteobacteria bacterium]|nr:hypothetical protein [Deltaproteobacteria bacterium]